MIFLGIIIGIAIMGAVSYLALDKKSNFYTRLASLAALAIMILTVIICIIIIFSDTRVPIDPSTLIVGAPPIEAAEENNNLAAIFFSILFFLALFVVVAFLALREHKRNKPKYSESANF
jgi:amino acid transporter